MLWITCISHYKQSGNSNCHPHKVSECNGFKNLQFLTSRRLYQGSVNTVTVYHGMFRGPADCIRMDEVRAVLKKMKRHTAPGLSGLVAEMIHATGDIGIQWILDLCNGIVKEGSIPDDWKSSVVLPIYKGKGDPMECGSYRGIKLLEHAMKVVERIFEHRIRQQIKIDDMQFRFVKGKGTTDAIFMARQMQENFRVKGKKLFWFYGFGESF